MEEDNIKEKCVYLEVLYLRQCHRTVDMDNSDLFPSQWSSISFEDKYTILNEALERNLHIIDTDNYGILMDTRVI